MKIISISVYGPQDRYIVGAKRQIELAQRFLEDWTVRIYTDNPANFMNCDNVDVVEVKDNSFGVFWRFRPMFEDPNNIVLVRDSDSRLTTREILCIKEWLESDTQLHIIRDHQAHYDWPIMAGLFGYKGKLPDALYQSMLLQQMNHFYTSDQVWLRDALWPFAQSSCLIHSITSTDWFKHSRTHLQNPFDFCGNGWNEHDLPIYPPDFGPTWKDFISDNNKFSLGLLGP